MEDGDDGLPVVVVDLFAVFDFFAFAEMEDVPGVRGFPELEYYRVGAGAGDNDANPSCFLDTILFAGRGGGVVFALRFVAFTLARLFPFLVSESVFFCTRITPELVGFRRNFPALDA